MSLFVALYPPAPVLDHLAAAVRRSRLHAAAASGVNVRLTARPLWHVTLVFLGEVPAEREPDAVAALRAGVARWRARRAGAGPPTVRLAGSGRFGRRRFTICWVGLAGEVDALTALGRATRVELRRARLPYDRKPWRPHLTFARPGDRLPAADVAADLSTLAHYQGPVWRPRELALVRSHPGPKPVHERLAEVALNSA